MTKFSNDERCSVFMVVLFAFFSIVLCTAARAEDAAQRFVTLNLACRTASDPILDAWKPRIKQVVESGDTASAEMVGCQSLRQTMQACEDAMQAISGLPALPLAHVELARIQARTYMLAHGIIPCN